MRFSLHGKLNSHLPDIALTLLIGQYAQAYYLGRRRKATLRDTILAWKEYLPLSYLPLPHPSPPNQPWLVKNSWFEKGLICELQDIIRTLKL
jgi:uracil-DNA glycosylase